MPTTKTALPLSLLLTAALATAQGGFVPPDRRPLPPPLQAVQTGLVQVRATIRDGASTTEIVQDLINPTGTLQEATFLLPLPDGAAADRFTMTVNGQEMPAEVLDANRARGIYEEIVRKRRDPGLLEYMGQGLLRARVFPVPPNGKVQVKVRYAEVLRESGGITSWKFPLRVQWADGVGPERLSLFVDVVSSTPIKNVFSPLAGLDIVRDGDKHAKASLELGRGQMPSRDLQVHYGLGEQDFGVHLLTARTTGDGYFLMLLSGKRVWPEDRAVARAINLVLDTSGSMQGEKIEQARAAVRTFLGSLKPNDWFNVIPFSTDARPFFAAAVPASKDNVAMALAKVGELEARGGTNIEEALAFALSNSLPVVREAANPAPSLMPITVFLTDGLPTVGQTGIDALLQQAKQKNKDKARIFVFGVGNDVNTRLLDTLAAETRGDRDYVAAQESIEVKTDALFQKLSGPVMTDLQLKADGIELREFEPRALPDLFQSGSLAIVGRYRGDGHKAIRLTGNVGGVKQSHVFEATFATSSKEHDWLPSLWAQRRIGALLDVIRLNGQQKELVDEVTRLGKEFGLVTPFTSHLILEEGMQVAQIRGSVVGGFVPDHDDMERLRRDWRFAGGAPATDAGSAAAASPPAAPADLTQLGAAAKAEAGKAAEKLKDNAETGAAAVDRSLRLAELKDGRAGGGGGRGAIGLTHRRIGERSFFLVDGVWVDGAYKPEMKAGLRKIAAMWIGNFTLLKDQPELGAVFALSTKLVVVVDGKAIEIG